MDAEQPHVVIVVGGFGVHTLTRGLRKVDRRARVILVEGEARVLSPYPDDLSSRVQQQLDRLGVEVRLSSLVTGIDVHCVQIGDETPADRT